MSSSNSLISLPDSFPAYQVILMNIATVYVALFVSISNHYVFKPKLEHIFQHSSIHSSSLHQFLIDIISNLTHFTFLLVSLFIFQDDNSLSVIIYSDMSWCGIFLAIVAFKAIGYKEQPNFKLMLGKSVVFLILIYCTIFLHYLTQKYFISIGIILILLYFINLVANGNQDKFVDSMEVLFGYKPIGQIQHEYSHASNMPCPSYLHTHFPVTKQQIKEHMLKHFKTKNIELKTKRKMTENLLKISLAIHLSKLKLEQKAKRDIRNYYGTFNGTIIEKTKKLILEKGNTYQEHQSQDQLNRQLSQQQNQNHNSAIFYLFPVKLFQGNKPLSVLFSITVNLGFGALMSVSLAMSLSLKYGQYLQLIYGILLLPVLPSVSKEQFVQSMTLSSLCKYFIYGLFITFVCLFSSTIPSFSFASNPQLTFVPLIQLIGLAMMAYFLFKVNTSPYKFGFIWLVSIIASSLMIFKQF